MGFLRWWKRAPADEARLDGWEAAWHKATETPDDAQVRTLRAWLDRSGLSEEDLEIEREMLEGLERLLQLTAVVAAGGIPAIETGHRVVGHDICHFTAPASMPDDAAQPSGRLILTNLRGIFAGSAKATALPWHAIAAAQRRDRDLLLVRADRPSLYAFRFNNYADALCAVFLSRRLLDSARREETGL
jgi:hypothetical protein